MLFKLGAGDWLNRRPWTTAAVSLLLAVHVVLAIGGIYGRSVTSDETAHLTSGVAYWQFADYRLQPENGNLPQRWGALPVMATGARLDSKSERPAWGTSMVWIVAQNFLFDSGQDTDSLLFLARCAMVLWSVASGLLVFAWAKAIWGTPAGLLALGFFTFSPTILANAPLVTSDTCAAFLLLAASYALWKLCVAPQWPRVLVAGLVLGLACVAKFSVALLVPTVALMLSVLALVWFLEQRRLAVPNTALALRGLALSAALAVAVIWTFYGWRFSTVNAAASIPPQVTPYLPWGKILEKGGVVVAAVEWARAWRLLPEPFLYGFAFVVFFAGERGAFLAGNFSTTGWWWFFPFTFLVKSTLGELLLTGALLLRSGLSLFKARLTTWALSPLLPLLAFGLVYGVSQILSHLNIGHRHILPLYLVLFVLSGALAARGISRLFPLVGLLALTLTAVESAANFPNHLAFFNRAAGGPEKGWQLLADSSLDWGQDVAPMAKWILAHRQPGERVYVSSFGTADPWHEGIPAILLAPYFSLGKQRPWYEFTPGLYCVSTTMLQDVYGVKPGPWTNQLEHDYQQLRGIVRSGLASGAWPPEIPSVGFHPQNALWLFDRLRFARLCLYLRVRRPDAVINHTQFIFRLSAAEIKLVTERPFSELAELITTSSTSPAP